MTAELIVANLLKNVAVSRQAVRLALGRLPEKRTCPCANALKDAIITPLHLAPEESRRRLGPIIERYAGERVAQG